jgi:hypothetical protein
MLGNDHATGHVSDVENFLNAARQLIAYLSGEARKAGKLRGKLAAVEAWTRERRISPSLTSRIRAYYAEVWLQFVGARRISPVAPLSLDGN